MAEREGSRVKTRTIDVARRVNRAVAGNQDIFRAGLVGAVSADYLKATGFSPVMSLIVGGVNAVFIYGAHKIFDRNTNGPPRNR